MSADERAEAQPADLVWTATELYALAPDQFTAARNERAKSIKQSGDKDCANQIRRLPKPSTAAWLVNMLASRRREKVDEVLDLGASLRQAQEDLDQQELKTLSRQRNELLESVLKEAIALAKELEHPVSEAVIADVERTLRAAMADTEAAAAVASGRLIRPIESTGWEPVDLDGAVAVSEALASTPFPQASTQEPVTDPGPAPKEQGTHPSAPAKKPAKKTARTVVEATEYEQREQRGRLERRREQDKRKEREERAEAAADLKEAERRAQAAETEQKEAERDLESVASKREQLSTEVRELKARIREAERDIAAIERKADGLERSREAAVRSAKEARRVADRARKRVERLSAHV